jgi:ABC-type uncharacterized transport system involved in gliding motility auxiliary subunit
MREKLSRYFIFLIPLGVLCLLCGGLLWALGGSYQTYAQVVWIAGAVLIALFILLDPERVKAAVTGRSVRYGSNAVLMSLIFLGILILINYLAASNDERLDLTADQRYSLSGQTIDILDGLKEPVHVIGFFGRSEKTPQDEMDDLLTEYTRRSDMISYEFVDPDSRPGLAREYEVSSYRTLVFLKGDKRQNSTDVPNEQTITSGILKVSRDEAKKVYFLTGHGERDPNDFTDGGYGSVGKALERDNYIVDKLNLAVTDTVPADCSVLVVPEPETELLPEEVERVEAYFGGGGSALITGDVIKVDAANSILEVMGIRLENDFVLDLTNSMLGDASTPVASRYPFHLITENLPMTFFPGAVSITELTPGTKNLTVRALLMTSADSWAETNLEGEEVAFDEGEDRKGPVTLGVAVERETKDENDNYTTVPQLVVFGDSDFASNAAFTSLGNGDLFVNSVNWLAAEEELISIRPNPEQPRMAMLTTLQRNLILLVSLILIPLAILVAGAVVWWRRR